MAILPIHSALQNPDIAGNFQQGLKFGTAQRLQRQAEQEQQQLRELAPAIQSGDPAAFGQAAVISPEYASAQQSVGDGGIRRLKGAITFIEQAQKTGNPRAVEAAYQQVRPYLSRFGQEPPATFAEAEPKFMEAKARIAMLDSPQGQQRNLSVSPGSAIVDPATGEVIYERPFAPQNQSFEFNGPDGRPRRFTFNTRTGQYEEAQLGGGAPQPTRFQTSTGEVIDISQVADPNVRAQILANPQQFGMVPDGGSVQLPPAQGGMPLVGRAPEEQAALTTGAQEAAKLQYLPQQEQIKTQAAIEQAGGVAAVQAAAKRDAERQAAQIEKDTALRLYEAGIEGLRTGLAGSETGPIAGRIPAFTTSQQIAEGGVAAMAPILKQLFRSAGEGTFTDKDQDLLLAMIPTRTDTPEARDAKLANIDSLVRAKLSAPAATRAPAQRGPQPGQVEDGYRFRGGNPADPNNWERL